MNLRSAPTVLSLVDGGVYDNLGLEWFQGWGSFRPDEARAVDFIILVDGSGPLVTDPQQFRTWRAINRSREVQYSQTLATRIRWFVENLLSGKQQGLHLASKNDPCSFRKPGGEPIEPQLYEGALPKGFASALSRLRTDLDRFHRHEAALLAYHGYWSVHARMGTFASALGVQGEPEWQEYRGLPASEADALLEALARGRKRQLRVRSVATTTGPSSR